jgi:superoxide dismutase, Fe-Mn family
MPRLHAVMSLAALTAVALAAPVAAVAQTPAAAPTTAPAPGPFTLAPLPYAYDALEPVIDAETMQLHHQRHHGAQVAGLNAEAAKNPALATMTLEQILAETGKHPVAVRNNAGGAWNHAFFWTIMAPPGTGGAPSPALAAAIIRDFGSMDAFKAQFRAASMGRFGSGWAWLIVTPAGKLAITSTPNQDNPLMDVAETRGAPILGNDMWEHAYYLKHRNRRADYVDGWWSVVNWAEVSRRFDAAVPR